MNKKYSIIIEKYAQKAASENTVVNYYGYSLGGGITLTTYAKLLSTNPELMSNVNSVNVYNPYIQFMEGYNDGDLRSDNLISNIKNLRA